MNEQLKESLMSFLEDLKGAKDFCVDQVPDAIMQMVHYNALLAWIGTSICISLLAIFPRKIIKVLSEEKSYCEGRDHLGNTKTMMKDETFFKLFWFTVFSAVGIFFTPCIFNAIKATFFTKWYILEFVMDKIAACS